MNFIYVKKENFDNEINEQEIGQLQRFVVGSRTPSLLQELTGGGFVVSFSSTKEFLFSGTFFTNSTWKTFYHMALINRLILLFHCYINRKMID